MVRAQLAPAAADRYPAADTRPAAAGPRYPAGSSWPMVPGPRSPVPGWSAGTDSQAARLAARARPATAGQPSAAQAKARF